MANRILTGVVAASLLLATTAATPVSAQAQSASTQNKMGYTLLSVQEAASLPRNGASLGLDVERSNEITASGMTFDLIKVKSVRRGSPGAQAGFKVGDEIIAVDSRVFPTVSAFAAYIGTHRPGTQAVFDYIPNKGGPEQAQRVTVTLGTPDGAAVKPADAPSTGMSTRTKVLIGAAALLGCYELGCFGSGKQATAPVQGQQQVR